MTRNVHGNNLVMQPECSDIVQQLESWYARDNGRYLLASIRTAVRDVLDTAFGYHILHLGVTAGRPLSQDSPIRHRIYSAEQPGVGVDLVAHPDELPLDSDSVDAVILHHCLEFAGDPHQVLREIQRVLTPQGHLLVIGFNPYSVLGVVTRLRGLLRQPLWQHHLPVSERRLADWLRLLGCEVQNSIPLYGLPPAGSGRLRQWMIRGDSWVTRHHVPVGGVYVLHATKQVVGLHPRRRKPRYSAGDRLIGLVPRPAPRPAPRTPLPRTRGVFEKKDVAA